MTADAMATPALQQISLSLSTKLNAIVPAAAADDEQRKHDLQTVRKYVDEYIGSGLPYKLNERHSPFNLCVTPSFVAHVKTVHKLLDRALVDVVERWFRDTEADFPGRMPLEPHEEALLRWIDGPGSSMMRPFATNYGTWRTDFLVEKDAAGQEGVRICEINGRLPFNGFWLSGLHEEATKLLGSGTKNFNRPNDFENTKSDIFNCFNADKPIYNIRSKWPGVDSRPMALEYFKRTGQHMVDVQPSELRLENDATSPTGYRLFYIPEQRSTANAESGKKLIEQCALELYQDEIAQIEPNILRQLAINCVNDFRTTLLCHDKRILGIVLEEIPGMVKRQRLSSLEALELIGAVIDTSQPGTEILWDLLKRSRDDVHARNNYIVKPIRDGSCEGIRLGKNMTQEEWLQTLERLAARPLRPSENACVVQRLVEHVQYDIVRHDPDYGVEQFHLIGSGHMINSQAFVLGPWRIGQDVHVGLGGEKKGIVMSAVLRPNLPELGNE